jgi:hypothetical protein
MQESWRLDGDKVVFAEFDDAINVLAKPVA